MKPVLNLSSSEIVAWKGENNSYGINNELSGDYHVPFMAMKDMKYLERDNV
jgi:hypothetical protein